MAEQWFLDLDGVRSGPYQTPEVMSLVAEGEVLPHHRISKGLKDQKWITILDWRMAQAKSTSTKNVEEIHIEKTKTEIVMDPTPPAPEPEPVAPPPVVEAPPAPPPVYEAKQEKLVEQTNPNIGKERRDPTAEMFDMLQNTKQKREAAKRDPLKKSGITIEPDSGGPSSGNLGKTLMIGLGIIFLGFGLGQVFQTSNPPASQTIEVKVTPTPGQAKPEHKTEVVDRSTDKMIIRSKIERSMESARTAPPPPAFQPPPPPPMPNNMEKRANDKEMEELKDLKRELQELKNLKDQNPDEDPDATGAAAAATAAGAPINAMDPPAAAEPPPGTEPPQGADPQVHY